MTNGPQYQKCGFCDDAFDPLTRTCQTKEEALLCDNSYKVPEEEAKEQDSRDERGNYIQTFTGKYFYVEDPQEDEICIADIAHALSMQCRYNGHCPRFYSVAEHSVLLARMVPKDMKRWALLHDASETYVPDVPRPFKKYLAGFKEIENKIMVVVAKKYNLKGNMPDLVHHLDTNIVGEEATQLWREPPDWAVHYEPINMPTIQAWEPDRAKDEFIKEFLLTF